MNTGQTLLTVGAMVLLGFTVLTINSTTLQHGQILTQTKIGIYATSLGISRVEEASGKAFDEASINYDFNNPTDMNPLSSPGSLGPDDAGEWAHIDSTAYFDDFDDYNLPNHVQTFYVPLVDSLFLRSVVWYVDPANPNGTSGGKSWSKKMLATVKAANSADTIKLSYIFSYFYFR